MKRLFCPFLYLLWVHLLALLFMSVFRAVFFCTAHAQLPPEAAWHWGSIGRAFLNGLWFDNVIACYLSALPLLAVGIASVGGWWRKGGYRACNVWFGVTYALVFMACAANVPYYAYFGKLLNASIWNWAEYGTQTLGMVFGEPAWYGYIALYFVAVGAFVALLFRLSRWAIRRETAVSRAQQKLPARVRLLAASATVVLLAGCLLGIRGRLGYNPIKVSAAYFCNHAVLNNLGVNPMFNLLYSALDELRPENRTLHLMPADKAVALTQQWLQRTGIEGISPIARQVRPAAQPKRMNVVVILMESMSARLMGSFGHKDNLTPCLDSLFSRSLAFANCYSAGIHTNHGLYATLYGFPSIMFRNAMKGSVVPHYAGLPTVLREQGYTTMFFMTHESQYDNMNAFLRTNGYEEIYAQEDYPADKVVNHFGVSDGYLFEYALPVLRRHAREGRPFLATLLTISNHPPYVVPQAFQTPGLEPEGQIVRYADRCIGDFMAAASREPWFANTLFVLLGDHGKQVGTADCELPECFNHIPLMIYGAPLQPEQRRVHTGFAVQEDVTPTLLGLLQIPYTQNNFGIDLLREQRPAAFYSADKTMAARDSSRLYVYDHDTKREFCYALQDGQPRPTAFSPEFASLKSYVLAQLQAADWLVQQGQTTDKP